MCRKYKKRHRKDLSPEDIEAIIAAAKVPHRLHKDIAQEFKIPAILVGKLVKESMKEPEKLEAYRTRLQQAEGKKQAIEEAATELLASNKPIVRIKQVQEAVEQRTGDLVTPLLISKVMRKEMRMGYRKTNVVPIQSNLPRCLVLRQQFAMRMIPLLESGRRIINVDESWLNSTRFVRRSWIPSDAPGTYSDK